MREIGILSSDLTILREFDAVNDSNLPQMKHYELLVPCSVSHWRSSEMNITERNIAQARTTHQFADLIHINDGIPSQTDGLDGLIVFKTVELTNLVSLKPTLLQLGKTV